MQSRKWQSRRGRQDSVDAYSAHDDFSAVEAPGRESSGGVMQPFLRGYEG